MLGAALLAALAAPARAGIKLDDLRGHASFGYGQLFTTDAPGGSLSFAGGLDYPIRPGLYAGIEVGSWLLGNRTVESGTLAAEVDYSVFEASALARWAPLHLPLMITAGPGVFHARASLSSAAAASFDTLAVEENVAGASLGATWIQRRPAPVRAGLELGLRTLWVPHHPRNPADTRRRDIWTLFSARLAIHY